jgi:hypothetical protein
MYEMKKLTNEMYFTYKAAKPHITLTLIHL